MKRKHWIGLVVLFLAAFLVGINGCRRVTLVGDSLFACSRDALVNAINGNNGMSWVYTEHIKSGCTSYNNPINQQIYTQGVEVAFGRPDVVVFSLGGNDMGKVTKDKITLESAIESFQTLVNQAVVAGASCIVLLESSHRFNADVPLNARFEMHMDDWYYHWHRRSGDNEYLGLPYKLLIADISEEIEANMDFYIFDYIHFNEAGAELAATAVVEQINHCPEGRWIFGANALKPEASFPENPYMEGAKKE
jgi:lysophospholipase L1-like esterase